MTSPIGARIDLDKLDLDRIEHSEYEIPTDPVKVASATRFGWYDVLSVISTDPDRLEAFAEAFLDAARSLRIVLGDPSQASDGDEIAAFPKAVA